VMEEATHLKDLTDAIVYEEVSISPSSVMDLDKWLREREGDVEVIASHLTSIVRALRDKKNTVPYMDEDKFREAFSRFPREYLTSKYIHLNLGAKAEVSHPDFEHPIKLTFIFQRDNVLGSHKLGNDLIHRIKITIPEKRNYSIKDLNEVRDTVRHELVHAVQEEIGTRNYLADRGGLPSSKRDTRFRQHDRAGQKNLRRKLEQSGLDPSLANFHALDDVEFYTRLLDEVEEFKSTTIIKNTNIHKWIKKSPFFRSLRHFKRKNWDKAVGLFYQAVTSGGVYTHEGSEARVARKIVQDLAGVQTWVSKNRQDQIQNDTSSPEPSRLDYQDGKPQRDRVLPLPSGHPKGRDEQRLGPPVSNTPSDSSGASLNYSMKSNPNAIPNQPDGKPLHQRPRSSGLPGEEYGHPYIDSKNTTGLARRPRMAFFEDGDLFDEEEFFDESERLAVGRAKINLKPPRKKQREQKGILRRKTTINYARKKRKDRGQMKRDNKRYYLRNKTRILRYQENRRNKPRLHQRLTGGGNSTMAQKNKRNKKAMYRDAVRSVLSNMYREYPMEVVQHLDFYPDERLSSEIESSELMARSRPKRGPGSRSTLKQQKGRYRRRKAPNSKMKQQKRKNRRYYKKNKTSIKRKVKQWRRKNKSKLKRYVRPKKKMRVKRRRASLDMFLYTYPLNQCVIDQVLLSIEGLTPCTRYVSLKDQNNTQYEMPLREFYYSADWDSEQEEDQFDNFITDFVLEEKESMSRRASQNLNSLTTLQVLLALLRSAHWSHWTSHWQVKGESQYGDHQLLERIYTGLIEEIDTLAEKIVGMYGANGVEPVEQAQLMANNILPLTEAHSERDPIRRALIIEEALQKCFYNIYNHLKEMKALSLGMDDFIMSIANEHETNLYLLRQRLR